MTYECYRTGEGLEPSFAINLATVLDGTQPNNGLALGTVWYETFGQLNSYVTTTFTVAYNITTGLIVLRGKTATALLEIVLPPYNGAAYYTKLTIVNQRNRVVYKVFDTSGTCMNAAALVFKTCYDIHDECCNRRESCRGNRVSLSRPRPIVNQRNRVVYKVFDTSGTCMNAAALVFKTCYDIHDECCNRRQSCRGNGMSLSRPRRELGCPMLQYSRYPEAEPHPLCADYHSCT
ncbi:hypothetical protein HPB50_022793 [Hyalomma asiaticum]|uniref:Uncharacterized protein n=1 Tax=Hyalomma asiaticum TaxID=266040 RepID=A0ACB7SB88_HYAAI|nr:hypothetical protein HPB50_022793 [Hyalomma asiaticum]